MLQVIYRILSETNNKEGIKVYEEGDFESVYDAIKIGSINQGKCMSIDTLLNIYR